MTDATLDTYRPLSILAVVTGVVGGLSLLAWISAPLLAVATFAFLFSSVALVCLWGRSEDVAGIRLAYGGWSLAIISVIGASLWHWYCFAIEVPAGYERVNLSDIFDSKIEDVTPDLLNLRGRRIAVKAYMDPFTSPDGATEFTISRMVSTGFGATVRPGERLVVELAEGVTCTYGQAPIVVSGVFDVERGLARDGTRFRLILREARIRSATSAIGLPDPNPYTC